MFGQNCSSPFNEGKLPFGAEVVVLPKRLDDWSLTSRRQRLVKTGGRGHRGGRLS